MLNLELSGEGVRSLTIYRSEVDCLRARAHLSGNVVDRNIKDYRRSLAMNVAARVECFYESTVA